MYRTFKSYAFPLILLSSLLCGGLTGFMLGDRAYVLKSLGDVFLQSLFILVVPLVFFSVSSAIAHVANPIKCRRLISSMGITFIFTGIIAGIFMLALVKLFPPENAFASTNILLNDYKTLTDGLITYKFMPPTFGHLFSHENMLPLIIFSILVGLGAAKAGESGKHFVYFLKAGSDTFIHVISYILYFAPIGFFCYFAALVSKLGPQVMGGYLHLVILYYIAGLFYFVIALSFYAYLAANSHGVKQFWRYISLPMLAALASCSSAACIPVNMQAVKKMGVSSDILYTVIPIGAVLHKDGSVLSSMLKIALLFGLFHQDFSTAYHLFSALALSLAVGATMGAIPSGGMLGEMLILSFYGFPTQALFIIVVLGLLIEPLATVLNVTGDSVSAMMVARLLHGRAWYEKQIQDEIKESDFLKES